MAIHRALETRGVQGEVVALSHGRYGDAELPVPVLGQRPRAAATLRALRRRAQDHDVVVAHGSDTLLACAASLAAGGPPFVYLSVSDPRQWARRAARVRTGAVLRRARAVAALSPGAADAVAQWYRLDRADIAVLPNFRSPQRFSPPTVEDRRRARAATGIAGEGPVVAVIGSMTPEKRTALALRGALALPGARVLVAGDGPSRPDVEVVAASAPDRVRLLGAVDDPLPVLHAADVLLMASASEAVPGVLVEAGLCGLPCVATDVGWVRDVVEDGVTGVVVEKDGDATVLGGALAEALRRRDTLGRAARRRCMDRFSDDAVLPAWVDLLRVVASVPAPAEGPAR